MKPTAVVSRQEPWILVDFMEYSAKELAQSPAGRERLAREQERHAHDILQPGNPMFEKVWGSKVKKNAEAREKAKSVSRENIQSPLVDIRAALDASPERHAEARAASERGALVPIGEKSA